MWVCGWVCVGGWVCGWVGVGVCVCVCMCHVTASSAGSSRRLFFVRMFFNPSFTKPSHVASVLGECLEVASRRCLLAACAGRSSSSPFFCPPVPPLHHGLGRRQGARARSAGAVSRGHGARNDMRWQRRELCREDARERREKRHTPHPPTHPPTHSPSGAYEAFTLPPTFSRTAVQRHVV